MGLPADNAPDPRQMASGPGVADAMVGTGAVISSTQVAPICLVYGRTAVAAPCVKLGHRFTLTVGRAAVHVGHVFETNTHAAQSSAVRGYSSPYSIVGVRTAFPRMASILQQEAQRTLFGAAAFGHGSQSRVAPGMKGTFSGAARCRVGQRNTMKLAMGDHASSMKVLVSSFAWPDTGVRGAKQPYGNKCPSRRPRFLVHLRSPLC